MGKSETFLCPGYSHNLYFDWCCPIPRATVLQAWSNLQSAIHRFNVLESYTAGNATADDRRAAAARGLKPLETRKKLTAWNDKLIKHITRRDGVISRPVTRRPIFIRPAILGRRSCLPADLLPVWRISFTHHRCLLLRGAPLSARLTRRTRRQDDAQNDEETSRCFVSGAVARHLVADLTEAHDSLSAVDNRHRPALGDWSAAGARPPRSRRTRRPTAAAGARHGRGLGRRYVVVLGLRSTWRRRRWQCLWLLILLLQAAVFVRRRRPNHFIGLRVLHLRVGPRDVVPAVVLVIVWIWRLVVGVLLTVIVAVGLKVRLNDVSKYVALWTRLHWKHTQVQTLS